MQEYYIQAHTEGGCRLQWSAAYPAARVIGNKIFATKVNLGCRVLAAGIQQQSLGGEVGSWKNG